MRKLFGISVLLSILFLCTSVAGAYSMWDIDVGDQLQITDHGPDGAGEFEMNAMDDATSDVISFTSWCAQQSVFINMGPWYTIVDLLTPSDESAWLLSQYWGGGITISTWDAERAFQQALWSYDDPSYDKYGTLDNYYTDLADDAVSGGWTNDAFVFIADLGVSIQNQYLPGQPVPEPATMILFGIGLIGMAGLGRKKLFQ